MKAISAFSLVAYIISLILVQTTGREEITTLLISYTICFAAFCFLIINDRDSSFKIYLLVAIGLLVRLVFIFLDPKLSDDFFRFIWDGNLMLNGVDPFAYTPQFLYDNQKQEWMEDIYMSLNSPEFYSVYPAVCQYLSLASAAIFPGSIKAIYVLKGFIWISECTTIIAMIALLKHFSFSLNNVLIYAINPLIIVELSGNMHFDSLAIAFTFTTLFLIVKNRNLLAGIFFALAIASKLTPLILIPFLLFSIKWNKLLLGALSCTMFLIILNLPFADELLSISKSLALYFNYFEFNASMYALVKWMFVQLDHYDTFLELKILLPILAFIGICTLQFINKDRSLASVGKVICFSWLIFFLLSTTIHPWYISMLVAGGVLCDLRFPLVWSFLIFLTYVAYQFDPATIPPIIHIGEYIILMIVILIDITRLPEPKHLLNSFNRI